MNKITTNVVTFRHDVFSGLEFPLLDKDWQIQPFTEHNIHPPAIKTPRQPVLNTIDNDKARPAPDTVISSGIQRELVEFMHEISQPLTAILLLTGGVIKKEEIEQHGRQELLSSLKIIFKQAARAVDMIYAHKHLATERKLDLKPEPMSEIIYDAVEFAGILAKESGVMLTTSMDKNKAIVSCDRLLLGQVLSNLIKNAIEAVSDNLKKPKEVKIYMMVEADDVVVIVGDNGVGMCKEDENLNFKPFHSSKETGTGLGLAISQKIIKAHNSCICVESARGAGSKFYFKLKIIKEPTCIQ